MQIHSQMNTISSSWPPTIYSRLSWSPPTLRSNVLCNFLPSNTLSKISSDFPKLEQPFMARCLSTNGTSYRRLPEENTDAQKGIWSRIGQRFNAGGIMSVARVIAYDHDLAVPHLKVPDIRWINWEELKQRGCRGIVFDKDNTITAPYALNIWPSIADSLEDCKSVFKDQIVLLSNSAGLYGFDCDGSEAKALEDQIGIPVMKHGIKKPLGTAKKIENYFGCDSSLLVMVGDRCFTDVIYGNRNGFLTILTDPLTLAGEPFIVRQVRKLENTLVKFWGLRGVTATNHRLLYRNHSFIKRP
eukprot:TRINITY_DN31273_c0_g1_i1.p1 TRINITY_DN31273_c0_g1~~TRINITY_DN31273_c0_g1_i1.p1  ORF type:complete len:300 (+),score=25.72 TRINITY_DN31273_c0_g1_i1:166-1065(+)